MDRLDLQVLTPVDWPLLKAARLDALKDSPAFMSRYELEWTWDESEWRRSIEATTWIVAREAERVVGLARSLSSPDNHGRDFSSPSGSIRQTKRRVSALLHKLAEVEHLGVTELPVGAGGQPRPDTPRGLGFTPTGKRQFLPEIARFEVQLKLPIRRSPSV